MGLEPMALATDGFYPIETVDGYSFCWASPHFSLRRPERVRYLDLELGRPNAPGRLTAIDLQNRSVDLSAGWHWYSLDLGHNSPGELHFEVTPQVHASGDDRLLGVMVRSIVWHSSPPRHLAIERARANAILNEQEYRSGAVVVRSAPPYLRVTLEVRCNIANEKPCVYCAWKWMKNEEIGAPDTDLNFMRDLGTYFSLARQVNDCSFGEPPLHRQFAQIVQLITADNRAFSFASNGQTLRRKIRRVLLGRNVSLYVSIDSATSSGYTRYRDNGFDAIIENLKSLCQEKKAHNNLPHVTVSFIVMHSNKNELHKFITLMHSIGVDRVKLMSLGREDCMDLDGRVQKRQDFTFNYDTEVIPISELEMIGIEAKRVADELGLSIYLDWKDFIVDHQRSADAPLCSEPWKTLYVLNRGIFPCCFGRKPLARWSERGDRSIEQFVEESFNGAALQEIRHSLANGVFPSYCLSSGSCPIVRQATADGAHPTKKFEVAAAPSRGIS